MSLRSRPDAFARTLVTAATIRPFWATLMEMKQARLRLARLASPPVPAHELPSLSVLATAKAA